MSNQGRHRRRNQQSHDGRRLETGMTRGPSPVYLVFPRAPGRRPPSEHTILQYASPADAQYRAEWLRQLEEQRAQSPTHQGHSNASPGHHGQQQQQQQQQQQHGNGNQRGGFYPQQQGVPQRQQPGQQHQTPPPHGGVQPPFVGQNADAQYAFQQNVQQNEFAVPMRRPTDVWYCCHCSFLSGPYPAWMPECFECPEQHKRCENCLRETR